VSAMVFSCAPLRYLRIIVLVCILPAGGRLRKWFGTTPLHLMVYVKGMREMSESGAALQVYLPGSCAQLVPPLQSAFARQSGSVPFVAARIDQTGNLAQAVIDGASVDVLMSANRGYVEQVRESGLIHYRKDFARNALCLLVRGDLAHRITGVPDLVGDEIRTLLCPSGSDPCGQYTVEMFERVGLGPEVKRRKAEGYMQEMGPGVAFDRLRTGEADAIIIYRSIASQMPELTLVELDLPYSMADRIVFAVGAIERDGQSHPDARSFVDFLTGAEAKSILLANNFLAMD
jgi:molybdenum ABC transporter molybdate-binding protein